MSRDCHVSFRREEDIARLAGDVRRLMNCDTTSQFDVIAAVRRFEGRKFGQSGEFNLEIFDGVRPLGFAYVSFEPLTMHIEQETWTHAAMGDPHSRHIIAHEIGHSVLHSKTAKRFSNKEDQFNIYGMEEHSAEWQADTFASYLLIPDDMTLLFTSVEPLSLHAGSPLKYASERFGDVRRRRSRATSLSSICRETCIACGNFSMVNTGLVDQCEFCGNRVVL